MNFLDFNISEHLKNSLNSLDLHNRMPHTIILNGGNEKTRTELATFLSMWAVCESDRDKPCGICRNCKLAKEHNHSDVYFARDAVEKKSKGKTTHTFELEEIDILTKFANEKPISSKTNVIIYTECDKRLTTDGQNKLLKTIEEPPDNSLFIFTCQSSRNLLPTVRSRATQFELPNEVLINDDLMDIAKEIVLGIIGPSEYKLMLACKKLTKREDSMEVLSYINMLLRDGLAVASNAVAITDDDTADKLSRKLTKAQHFELMELTTDAQTKIMQNISLNLLGTWLCGKYRRIAWQR